MKRYKVIEGSESGHCCFDFTVVDTAKPRLNYRGEPYGEDDYETVCECFDEKSADLICQALNEQNNKLQS